MTDVAAETTAAAALSPKDLRDIEKRCKRSFMEIPMQAGTVYWSLLDIQTLIAEMRRLWKERDQTSRQHFGDPCIYCGKAWDQVAIGDCPGHA